MPVTTNEPTTSEAKERVRTQYGSVGDAYVKSVGHATGSDLQRMVELAAPRPTDCLLDIATGGGHVARVFAPLVADVVASDLTPEILAEELPFGHASFDIVTCRIAPHHFPNPDRFVAEASRVLRPSGRFVLVDSTVPEGDPGAFFNRFELLHDQSHVRSLTVEAWIGLIENAGLTATNVESFRKRHDFDDWTSRSLMADDDKAVLGRMMQEADDTVRGKFAVEVSDGNLVAFADTKTLFVALKS
jgi:ubiquinone/menaquinone biosynthesis C-methylase UbiE